MVIFALHGFGKHEEASFTVPFEDKQFASEILKQASFIQHDITSAVVGSGDVVEITTDPVVIKPSAVVPITICVV